MTRRMRTHCLQDMTPDEDCGTERERERERESRGEKGRRRRRKKDEREEVEMKEMSSVYDVGQQGLHADLSIS